MLATPGPLPADDAAFAYETKWDGVRIIAYVRDGSLHETTRYWTSAITFRRNLLETVAGSTS